MNPEGIAHLGQTVLYAATAEASPAVAVVVAVRDTGTVDLFVMPGFGDGPVGYRLDVAHHPEPHPNTWRELR